MRFIFLLALFVVASCASAQNGPATQPAAGAGKLPHVQVDVKSRQIRVEAEYLPVDAPLEFFCVLSGTSEHEAVLRSPAKPSHIHLALLMLGLQPGEPVKYSEALKRSLPPHGPPLQISVEWEKDGKTVSYPAYRLMRDIHTKKEMRPMTWIFAGSRVMEDGSYAADTTGYLVSVVNFDLTLIDIPELASNANETLEWERNPDIAPPEGAKLTMVIEPAGKQLGGPTSPEIEAAQPGAATQPALSDVTIDQAKMDRLRERWTRAVSPHAKELRDAAQAHYEVINAMRREQQRLVDEADRIQRTIDQLEKDYQDMTTPRPEPIK
jgi:hypothetical protein